EGGDALRAAVGELARLRRGAARGGAEHDFVGAVAVGVAGGDVQAVLHLREERGERAVADDAADVDYFELRLDSRATSDDDLVASVAVDVADSDADVAETVDVEGRDRRERVAVPHLDVRAL